MMFYSCSDTLFNKENCSRIEAIYFNSKTKTVLDTLLSGKHFTSRKTEVSQEFIKVTETSILHDTTQSLSPRFTGPHATGLKVDSLVLNAAKNPIELYENRKLNTTWAYDSIGRITIKIDNINNPNTLKTTTISYQPNTITETTQTKFYDEVSNHKYVLHFDAKRRHILREDIYNEKTKFLYKDKKIYFDSIILHEPSELSRYTVYNYKPSNTQIATFYDLDQGKETVLMTVIRKLDKKERNVNQYVLNEKGDTLSYDMYQYRKKKIIKASYQDNKFLGRTTKYLNNNGQLIKQHDESSDPFIWKMTWYNEEILTKDVDVNHDYKRMRIVEIEK